MLSSYPIVENKSRTAKGRKRLAAMRHMNSSSGSDGGSGDRNNSKIVRFDSISQQKTNRYFNKDGAVRMSLQ